MKDRWAEKEERLKVFYKTMKNSGKGSFGLDVENARSILWHITFAIFYWSIIVAICVWILYNFEFARYVLVAQISVVSQKYCGFQMLEIDYYNLFFSSSSFRFK